MVKGAGSGSASATGTAIPCASRRARDRRTELRRNFILALYCRGSAVIDASAKEVFFFPSKE
jgi:hypothetical protein